MIEKRITAQAYKVVAGCECGGELKSTGVMKTSFPAQFAHVCNTCGKAEYLLGAYPRMEFVSEDGSTLIT